MYKKQNLHTHCTFCDGKNTAEEMVLRAIEEGSPEIGFTSHSYKKKNIRIRDTYKKWLCIFYIFLL